MVRDEEAVLAASLDERRRIARLLELDRRRAQAEAVRVVARLEFEATTRRLEETLRSAELTAARLGRLTEPVKGSWLSRLFGLGTPLGTAVILGPDELQAVVNCRREQLERFRTVEGPELIRRAEGLAAVLNAGGDDHDQPKVEEPEAASKANAASAGLEATETPGPDDGGQPTRPLNGRSRRAEFG